MSLEPALRQFRIASYNIRKCLGTDRRRDPGRILSVVAALDAEIVALQEADLRLGRRPAALPSEAIEDRTGLRPVPLDHSDISLGWHGNAILVAPGIEVQEVEPLDLPGLEPRGALRIDLLRGGEGLRLVAVHLGLRRRDRQRQMAAIRARLAALPARPTLIVGDFNEWSPERGVEPLKEDFDVHTPGRSWHARFPMAALDRFAATPDLSLIKAGVVDTALARRASDHLPIWGHFAATPG